MPEKWKHLSFFLSVSHPVVMVSGLKRQRMALLGNIALHGSSVEDMLALVAVVWLLEIEGMALLGLYDDYFGNNSSMDRWFTCFMFAPECEVRWWLKTVMWTGI